MTNAMTNEKTLYIVRHGQTDLNKQGIVQGRGMDTDLNDEGRKQAQLFYRAYKHVPFDKIYISNLKRTQQSIQPFIDLGIPYEKLPGWMNWPGGYHEGQASTPENKAAFLQIMRDWLDGKLDSKFEGGESPNEVKARQLEALKIIMSHPEEKTVLICMHGRALRLFLPVYRISHSQKWKLFRIKTWCCIKLPRTETNSRSLILIMPNHLK